MRTFLSSRQSIGLAVLVGLVLMTPSLDSGFAVDDFIHDLLQRDDTGIDGMKPRPYDVFVFAPGDSENVAKLTDLGMFPWWSDPEFKLAFFRPLSSITHQIDHVLWAGNAPWMHAHSLIWFAFLLVVLGFVFRTVHGGHWIGGLALLLYAIDDARGPTVGWIANRNALIAATFGFASLAVFVRTRQSNNRWGQHLALFLYAAGLLAGESAIATCGYLFAYTLFLDDRPTRHRVLSLLPFVALTLVWKAAYALLGYGAHGSGVYVDPASNPLDFLHNLVFYLPALIHGQFGLLWSDFWIVLEVEHREPFFVLNLLVCVLLAALFTPLVRHSREARFWLVGCLLAMVPICATFPADRLLTFTGVGAAGLLAVTLGSVIDKAEWLQALNPMPRRGLLFCVAGLAVLHIGLAPPLAWIRASTIETIGAAAERAMQGVPDDPSIENKTVIAVHSPSESLLCYLPTHRQARGIPRPRHIRSLFAGMRTLEITRSDPQTLIVNPRDGFLAHTMERMTQSSPEDFEVGWRRQVAGMRVEVLSSMPDGRPAKVAFHFDRPLNDPSFVWLTWQGSTFVAFTPPQLGETVQLDAPTVEGLLLGTEASKK
jgi:hypothetical protein